MVAGLPRTSTSHRFSPAGRPSEEEIGSEYSRRPPSHSEGFRIARQMLAGIPDKISLDSKSEYEDVSKLLSAFLSPPLGEPSPERLQSYIELSKSIPVYRDALRRHYEELDSPPKIIFRPALTRIHRRTPMDGVRTAEEG